ncbi:ubiquitin-like modifier-activating enzyme 7 isoform X4 [Leptonychotes weddellii]|uniref:Ubiquitin-like modifier-activating enzyme 7 n=1 Tax=Leptonychotes weddellii TaxID=9713 RepID=A0A7F8R6G1_LEPWE|nr:ubiquitin-like modifier-activating enzyme 7 isoform X4 [Leptonychotes weddellii]
MAVLETSKSLDEELYSRQLCVLDLPAMQRIRRAKVLLSGLQGLGAEVAKNLVLMGVGSLTLHDPHPTCWSDLAAQFFLSEKDLERSRAEASQEPVAKLNGAVQVCVHTGDLTEELLPDFQVVVLTASKLEEQLRVGALCHKLRICFLVADTRGLVGQLFSDFGEDFTVQDPTEAEPLTAAIQHISQGSPGILTLRKEADARYFHDGDLVTFSGIEGMVELNGCDPRPIRVQEDGTLEIGNTAIFSRYLRGGAVTEVKKSETVSHKPLDVALLHPRVVAQSPQEADRARCLHQAFRALHQFEHLNGRLPQPWDPDDAEMVVGLARSLEPLKGTEGEPLEELLDEALVQTVALSSAGGLSPMAAMLGAVAAQEVLKAISRKFMPLDQWLYFDALDCLPEDGKPLPTPEDCAPRPKAEVAAEATHRLNSDLQVTPLTYALDPTTEHIYEDNFFSRVDGVAAALDSFQARHYVAARCTHYLKPLLEAGTQGTSGHASVFVPHVTEAYRAPASGLASEDATYPVCTLRHFPSTVEHTVQWARDEFEGLFCLSAETINRHHQELTSLAETDGPQVLTLLEEVLGVLRERPRTWQDCVVWALGHWQRRFHYGIMQLLSRFPPDKVLEDGTLFWSGPKQCPEPLEFDASQDTHLLYVLAAANLYARMHGLPGSRDQTALRELLKMLPLPVPPLSAASFPNDLDLAGASAEFGPEQLKKLHQVLEVWSGSPPLEPLKFEKASQDNDSNFHVDFVVAAASLRAQNYGIPPANRTQSKRIVGQIIPAIATTTAAVAGLVGLELYKLVGGPRPLSAFRHSYLHLAENRFSSWVPCAPAIQKLHYLTWTWTCWNRLKVPAGQPEKTLELLLAHLHEQFGLRVMMLLHGRALLYSARWSPNKQAQHLALRVTELVQRVTGRMPKPGQRVLVLELSCEGEEEDTTFPPLHYELCDKTAALSPGSTEPCIPSPQ